jgi:Domain of unknown function (DUF4265)
MAGQQELVRVQFYEPDVGYENLWAAGLRDDKYRLESIPFFVYGVALHDVIIAKPDTEGRLQYISVVEHSGNRTLRARSDRFVADAAWLKAVTGKLKEYGCAVEELRSRLLAVNVPSDVDLTTVTTYLSDEGISWEYAHPEEMNA